MRKPYGPVYEAYTHFGASAEDAIKAIKAPKGVMTGASLGFVWGPETPGDRENGKPEQKYSDLHFESQGEKHTLELEYIANGSYNTVYGVKDPSIPLILRVSIPPEENSLKRKLTEAERAAIEHEKRLAIEEQLTELQFMRSMGKSGIGPRVYATVLFTDPSMTGVFTEKLEMSLLDAESCPYRTRRAFVDADAESALVDLYARSSRLFECIDTKSPNVLFTPGRPGVDARIAMIDMDPGFCRDAAQSSTGKKRPTPTTTTLDDLEAHLSRRSDSRDSEVLDSACISLLIHCICSMERLHPKYKGNDTASGYGFPYPRVAAHMYNNWPYVWSLVLKHRTMQSGFSAASMVAHYHFANKKQKLTLDDCDRSVRKAIARAICAPMTRLLLMTKGRDVHDDRANDKINIVNIDTHRVVSGDMYVRLARVHDATGGEDTEMSVALNAHDTLGALHTLASRRERRLTERFRCRASTKNGELVCCHNPGDLFCDTASSVGVRYSEAVYSEPASAKEPKWRDTVSIDPEKTLQELDRYETARFLCDQMNDIARSSEKTHYSIARTVFKRTHWTGLDLARMVDTPSEMLEEGLRRHGAPPVLAKSLVRRIKWYIEQGKTIGTIGPCAPHF